MNSWAACGSQVVKDLLKVGPMLNAIDADGNGALHLAAQDGHADIVALLKEHGVVDGLPNLEGLSPADLARTAGHAAIARTLAEGATRKACHDGTPLLVKSVAKLDMDVPVELAAHVEQLQYAQWWKAMEPILASSLTVLGRTMLGHPLQDDEVPAAIWDLVELALQSYKSGTAPTRRDLEGAVQRACKQVPNGTYLGSTIRFLLRKHSCPADL